MAFGVTVPHWLIATKLPFTLHTPTPLLASYPVFYFPGFYFRLFLVCFQSFLPPADLFLLLFILCSMFLSNASHSTPFRGGLGHLSCLIWVYRRHRERISILTNTKQYPHVNSPLLLRMERTQLRGQSMIQRARAGTKQTDVIPIYNITTVSIISAKKIKSFRYGVFLFLPCLWWVPSMR